MRLSLSQLSLILPGVEYEGMDVRKQAIVRALFTWTHCDIVAVVFSYNLLLH